MNKPLTAQQGVLRLLAAAWDRQVLPPPEVIAWPEVLSLVEPSNVGALVYTVTQHMNGAIAPDVQQALEQAFYRSATANIRCLNQLAQVGQALAGVGAPLLLLKGAALAEQLYGDVALRLIGDIDLAVPAEYVPACRKALIELGYVPGQVEHRTGTLLANSNQELFEPPPPYPAPVELHWHLLDVPYYMRHVPMDWFWQNTETLLVAGQPFQVLNPEANLIYLPAHLALHHRFERLHSFVDLALLIEHNRDRLDWQKVIAAARLFELVSALRATLDYLADWWPSLPIEEPRRLLHDLQPSPADARLFRLLTAEARSVTLDFYTTLISLPDVSARARFAWFNLFPQPAYMVARYAIKARWQLPYWYLRRLTGGVLRFVSMLPRAWRIDH